MTSSVKNYIERYIKLFEQGKSALFFASATHMLSATDFECLISTMTHAGVDVAADRSQYLLNKLTFLFTISPDRSSVKDLLVGYVFGANYDTFFGWTVDEVFEFITKHDAFWQERCGVYFSECKDDLILRRND